MAKTKKTNSVKSDVDQTKFFWLSNGRSLKNLNELADVLDSNDMAIWNFHVTADKNDFANWIEGVFEDVALGKAIRKVKNPKTAAKRIRAEIVSTSFWSFL